jgi:hypothetical protein|tara:strand:+ start:1007 stop:1402 length:396 start_codon:yes stop_codon:yes gene_type:complete
MTTISNALVSLGLKEWVYRGNDATTEAEFNERFRKVTESKDGFAIESSDPKDFGVTWKQVSDEKTKLENAEPLRLLREERNKLLQETDWTALGDVTISDKMKTYRQELRDITKTFQSMSDKDFKFPDKPES